MANGKRAEFSPAELDRIEDALESLEAGTPAEDVTPAMRERLLEYENILNMSREAMPLQDVPAGALDAVLAEARDVAAGPAKPAVVAGSGMWGRLRRTVWLPTLALAGSAALVLWWVRPRAEQAMSADQAEIARDDKPVATPIARGSGKLAQVAEAEAEPPADGAPPGQPGEAVPPAPPALDDRELDKRERGNAAPLDESVDGAPGGPPASRAAEPKRRGKNSPSKTAGGFDADPFAGDAPSPTQRPAAPPPQSGGKADDAVAGELTKGDTYRQQDRCDVARRHYKKAVGSAVPETKARGYAGLGLCDLAEDKRGAADANFSRARKAWPQIGSFIRREQSRYTGGASSKKSKAKPQAQQAAEADDGQ